MKCCIADKIVDFIDDIVLPESASSETQRPQPKRQPKKLGHTLKKTKKLVLHVYGMSSARIDSAIQELESLCKDAKKQKTLKNPQVQDFVSKMTHEQVVTYCQYFIKMCWIKLYLLHLSLIHI